MTAGIHCVQEVSCSQIGFPHLEWLHKALPSLFSGHQLLLWTGEQRTYRNLGSLRKTAVGRGFVWTGVFIIGSDQK